MLRRLPLPIAAVAVLLASGSIPARAQQSVAVPRLSSDVLDVRAPSDRVAGAPGEMRVTDDACRPAVTPTGAALRRRIVDVAVQEWAYFGFGVVDQSVIERRDPPRFGTFEPREPRRRGGRRRIAPTEAARLAPSIAGYWTVTPEGAWIIDQQNVEWNGRSGIGARWESPWSAAFISWVMCEAGLAETSAFHRAVAHHRYIDQAIRARDGAAPASAFVAYDAGETAVAPGDLLCSGRRPAYTRLAERRRQMGEGARTHCDIVVKVDADRERILAIGGNVGSSVSLKVMPATRAADGSLHPFDFSRTALDDNPYRGARPVFAHLKLRADAIEGHALETSPTIRAIGCAAGLERLATVSSLLAPDRVPRGC